MAASDPLAQLRRILLSLIADDPDRGPLGGLGLFHARRPQALRSVPIHQPSIVLVLSGRKSLFLGSRDSTVSAGQLLLLPAASELTFGNHPEPGPDGCYLALVAGFSPEAVARFVQHYAAAARAWDQAPLWSAPAPAPVLLSLAQWVDLARHAALTPELGLHRQVELLLLLAQAGLAGNLLLARQSAWRQRVAALLAMDPAHPWEVSEVARRLNVGASSLRRHLHGEGSGFRELLEEVRLVAGLGLLQETFWSVARVAAEVGYDSPSRFSERFRRRFGVTPSELKRTRLSDPGEAVSVGGEPSAVG